MDLRRRTNLRRRNRMEQRQDIRPSRQEGPLPEVKIVSREVPLVRLESLFHHHREGHPGLYRASLFHLRLERSQVSALVAVAKGETGPFPDHVLVDFPDHVQVDFPDHALVAQAVAKEETGPFPDHVLVRKTGPLPPIEGHVLVDFPDHVLVDFPDHALEELLVLVPTGHHVVVDFPDHALEELPREALLRGVPPRLLRHQQRADRRVEADPHNGSRRDARRRTSRSWSRLK